MYVSSLINILRQAVGMSPIKFSKNASTPFVAMENIQTFNRAAAEYGLPDTDLFQSVDLYEGHRGPQLNVINCLNRLGTVVSSLNLSHHLAICSTNYTFMLECRPRTLLMNRIIKMPLISVFDHIQLPYHFLYEQYKLDRAISVVALSPVLLT